MTTSAVDRVGFIGLGNVGGKLAASLLRQGFEMVVRDLDRTAAEPLLGGAQWADNGRDLATQCDVVVTCLPSPAASANVMEAPDGVIAGLRPGTVWLEMSTTDDAEVRRLGELVAAAGGVPLDAPVSGGCHRAGHRQHRRVCRRRKGCVRAGAAAVGRNEIVHLGSASVLKVVTNYLAGVHLLAIGSPHGGQKGGSATATGIRVSSGNSFA